jgi:hypothetical protein
MRQEGAIAADTMYHSSHCSRQVQVNRGTCKVRIQLPSILQGFFLPGPALQKHHEASLQCSILEGVAEDERMIGDTGARCFMLVLGMCHVMCHGD